jgi:hypothetical protein
MAGKSKKSRGLAGFGDPSEGVAAQHGSRHGRPSGTLSRAYCPPVTSTLDLMKVSTLSIGVLWVASLVGAVWGGLSSSSDDEVRRMLSHAPLLLQLAPIPFFAVVGWRAPHSPFFNPAVAEVVDAHAGAAAFETFISRLRPLLMFGVTAILSTTVEAYISVMRGVPLEAGVNVFFLAGGIGFVLAHWILRARKVRGA